MEKTIKAIFAPKFSVALICVMAAVITLVAAYGHQTTAIALALCTMPWMAASARKIEENEPNDK